MTDTAVASGSGQPASPDTQASNSFQTGTSISNPGTVSANPTPAPSTIEEYYDEHLGDPNFDLRAWHPDSTVASSSAYYDARSYPTSTYPSTQTTESYEMRSTGSLEQVAMEYEESPYPEVRAAISSVDDPNMPVNTFRMWFLGLLFVFSATAFNQVLVFRYPSVLITGIVIQLLSLPFGLLLAHILPRTIYDTFGYKWTLNPGPFSVKEHVCITIMGNLACNGVYAMETVICRKVFYNMEVPYKHQFLLAIGTQVFGFSLAGLMRRFVVWPARMIWPNVLAACALYNSLHQGQALALDRAQQQGSLSQSSSGEVKAAKSSGKALLGKARMSRGKFLLIVSAASFVYAWFPSYLFTALSMFNWVCWIWPESPAVNVLFGTASGLGMSMITLDWSMIAFFGSPLVNPWWAQANVLVSFVLVVWIVIPVLYFRNTFYSAHFPPMSTSVFANDGQRYQVLRILTNGVFDPEKYAGYSPPYLSLSFAIGYGLLFATFSAIVMHTFLWFRKDILRQFRRTLKDEQDIHSRLIRSYLEVPGWWYTVTGLISLAFIIVSNHIIPTQLPFWALLVSLLLSVTLILPLSILQAIANQAVNINGISQLMVGYMVPGRPIASIIFKSLTITTVQQSIIFSMDLKTGHYMKVPPRVMFMVQLVAAAGGSILVVLIQALLFGKIEDMCAADQKDGFVCPGSRVFFTSSVIWGSVGPAKLFSPGQLYSPLLWFFLLGFLLPVPFYFLAKRFPLGIWRYVNVPILVGGLQGIVPGTGMNLSSWLLCGFIFNFVVRRRYMAWWVRYNYVLSAALDIGFAFALLVIFFMVMVPKGGVELKWWGNSVWMNTMDAMGIPYKPIPKGSTIGPPSW